MKPPRRSKTIWLACFVSALGAAMDNFAAVAPLIPFAPLILMCLGVAMAVLRHFTTERLTTNNRRGLPTSLPND